MKSLFAHARRHAGLLLSALAITSSAAVVAQELVIPKAEPRPPAAVVPKPPPAGKPAPRKLTTQEIYLLGPDADGNGVRDDVDKLIAGEPSIRTARKEATAYAASVTHVVVAGARDGKPDSTHFAQLLRTENCFAQAAGSRDMIKTLLEAIMDTPDRHDSAKAWYELNRKAPRPQVADCVDPESVLGVQP